MPPVKKSKEEIEFSYRQLFEYGPGSKKQPMC